MSQAQASGTLPQLRINAEKNIESKSAFFALKANGHIKELMHFSELLIQGSSFILVDKKGNSINLRLPDKIQLKQSHNLISFQSHFKHEGEKVQFEGEISPQADQIHFKYSLKCPALEVSHFVIQLNPKTYIGNTFKINERPYSYPKIESREENLWRTLVANTPLTSFTASIAEDKNFILTPQSKTNLSVKYLHNRWQDNFSLYLSCEDRKSIQFSLRIPQSQENSHPLSRSQANLLSNGSFEVGTKDWGVSFSSLNNRSSYSSQVTPSPSGQRALVLDHRPVDAKYQQAFRQVKIQSEYVQIPARTPITFSFDVKSAAKVIHAKMIIRYQSAERIANAGTSSVTKYIRITPEWQRHSLSLRLPRGMNDAYSFGLEAQGQEHLEGSKIYFDGAAVRIGNSKKFTAEKELIIGADIPQKHNLFEFDQAFNLKTHIKNNSAQEQSLVALAKIFDPYQKLVLNKKATFTIPAHQNNSDFLKDLQYQAKVLGPHKLVLEIYRGNELLDQYQKAFGFIKSRPNKSLNTASKFGLHMGGENYQECLALASRIGFTWTRSGAFYNSWRVYQPSKLAWNQKFMDRNLAIIEDHEKLAMTPIVTLGVQTPRWASSAPASSPEYSLYPPTQDKYADFGEYVKKLTQSFGKRIHAYEIWNEPNTSVFYRGTPKEFAGLIDASCENISAHNPEVKIIGFGLTHYGESASDFMLNSLTHTQSNQLDGVSFHPYSDDRLSPEKTRVQTQFEWIQKDIKKSQLNSNLELWATEFGWFAPHQFSKEFTPYKNASVAKRLISEQECARFYVQMVNTSFAYGLDKLFYFIFQEGSMSNRWFHGFVGPNAEFLKAPYYAASTAIKNLDFKTCLGQERFESGLVLTRYKQDMSVLWNHTDHMFKIQTMTPLQCEDIYGNEFTLNPINGTTTLLIGEDPIYVKSLLSPNQITSL